MEGAEEIIPLLINQGLLTEILMNQLLAGKEGVQMVLDTHVVAVQLK